MLYNRVKDLPLYVSNRENFRKCIKNLAYKIMYKSKKEKVQNIISEKEITVLKDLGKNENLHITRPDKGNGVVILNNHEYIDKMELLLNDPLVFENQYHHDPLLKIMHSEDKINRMLKKLKNDNIITEEEYKHLYASGSTPGTLYGLPKIQKPNIPIRPILSAINTPNYKLAKFLIPSIEHLTKSEYVLKTQENFLKP